MVPETSPGVQVCVELDRVHLYLLLEYVSDMEGLRGFHLQIDVDTVSVNAEL